MSPLQVHLNVFQYFMFWAAFYVLRGARSTDTKGWVMGACVSTGTDDNVGWGYWQRQGQQLHTISIVTVADNNINLAPAKI